MTPTRRAFLRSVAGAGSLGAGLAIASSPAVADHPDAQPAHVSLEFDQDRLERYRPRLVMAQEDREKFFGLYGWVARSQDYDTDVCVYFAAYTHQTGVTSYDSHHGDREPIYTFVDKNTGDVRGVAASIYHWLRGWTATPTLDGDHPKLRVISPWHHYSATTETGSLFDVEDLHGELDAWLANGLEADLAPGTVYNPWTMAGADGRDHWWRHNQFGFSLTAFSLGIRRSLGFHTGGSL